ncbi:MAG: amidohydrolase family protein [Chitinophagales bacterium]|nr:amidohydrolase family protein [Chitinophagales bacterium]
MRKIAGDIIYPITSKPVTDQVMLVSDAGQIIGFRDRKEFTEGEIETYRGALVPGFVNTHCHLELSHLKNKFPEKTGLIDFLLHVTKLRTEESEVKQAAIDVAEQEMNMHGIVAVGDMSNTTDSFKTKARGKLYYHTFIELISLDPFNVYKVMEQGEKLLASARSYGIHASLAPHAPYSVSSELLKMIARHCYENGKPTTIHMLECADENLFFYTGGGGFKKLYTELNISLKNFSPSERSSSETILPLFNRHTKTQLVHNTYATVWDIAWAEDMHPNLFWCLCPQANLYIENKLPDITLLKNNVEFITIGTDSLASNHRLSVLDELMIIQKHFPSIQADDLFRWSTLYGAKFLGIEEKYGSFDTGKFPGVNLIKDFNAETRTFRGKEKVQKIL